MGCCSTDGHQTIRRQSWEAGRAGVSLGKKLHRSLQKAPSLLVPRGGELPCCYTNHSSSPWGCYLSFHPLPWLVHNATWDKFTFPSIIFVTKLQLTFFYILTFAWAEYIASSGARRVFKQSYSISLVSSLLGINVFPNSSFPRNTHVSSRIFIK